MTLMPAHIMVWSMVWWSTGGGSLGRKQNAIRSDDDDTTLGGEARSTETRGTTGCYELRVGGRTWSMSRSVLVVPDVRDSRAARQAVGSTQGSPRCCVAGVSGSSRKRGNKSRRQVYRVMSKAGQYFITEVNLRESRESKHGPGQMGWRYSCTNQKSEIRKSEIRNQRSGGLKCPKVASASLSLSSLSSLPAAGGTCTAAALLAPGGIGTWAGDLAGAPCADTFLAVPDGSDGVPRRANLAEPVPWPQASSWPLDVTLPHSFVLTCPCYPPSPPQKELSFCRVPARISSCVFRGPIRAFREPDGHASLLPGF